MASSRYRSLFVLILHEFACSAVGVGVHANPIRKVVNLLEAMANKIEAEGEKEENLFEKFECYCKTGTDSLQKSIASAEAKVPELESEIGEAKGELDQLKNTVEQQKKDRSAAKNDASRATSLRENEGDQYAKESADLKANIAAMTEALVALRKGTGQGFLQTHAAAADRLRKLIPDSDVDASDRETISLFLQGNAKTGTDYAPQSGEIIGILEQLKETMEGELADATASEKNSITSFQGLLGAKKKEIEALTTSLEEKMTRIGDTSVALVNKEEDLKDTSEALASDQAFLAELKKNCGSKEGEWEKRKKVRSDEILAIHETIKLLNDDDALDLFKKTLPSASFVQLQLTSKRTREQSRAALSQASPHRDVRVDFISLALKGKQVGFEKVKGMIDEMASLLAKEASSDERKKTYCEKEIDETEDELKEIKRKSSDLETAIVESEQGVKALAEEIKMQQEAVKALDKQVLEATQQRKDEHADFVETLAANNAAIQLLGLAKNRLLKFYNPSMAKPDQQRSLADDDQIAVNFGGSAPPTPAPGGIANTGISGLVQIASSQKADPGDTPQTWSGKLEKKESESQGVTQMINLLVQDLSNEVTLMETEEQGAQADYEQIMKSSAAKRAIDVRVLTEKEGAKADGEATLQKYGEDARVSQKAAASTLDALGSLHQDCDWLLQNFGIRREARSGEIDSLKRAKAVLAGADYSLLQTSLSQKRSSGRTRISLGQRQMQSSPEETLATEMTHDLEMNFNKIAPFGKEDTAKELQDHAAKTQNTLVDAVENAEVAEIKRAVFRALTRLRAATIKEFDTIARLETQAIDAYNDAHHYRAENPLAHLHEDEAPVETDKLKSFH